MTNIEVLRAVQHAWPSYCWPFPNGNGYALTSPPLSPDQQAQEDKLAHHLSFRGTHLKQKSPSVSPDSCRDVKTERLSPVDHDMRMSQLEHNHMLNRNLLQLANGVVKTSLASNMPPSPSISPKSLSSTKSRTPFNVSPPLPSQQHTSVAPFTPMSFSSGCFSPSSIGGLPPPRAAQTPNFLNNALPRNCSDLMRSLAAKYKNKDNINHKILPKETSQASVSSRTSVDAYKSLPPPLLPTSPNHPFSSTQALLDLVKNASTSNRTQNTAPILKSNNNPELVDAHPKSMKRPAEAPLDLSSSFTSKRRKLSTDETYNISTSPAPSSTSSSNRSIDSLLSWSVDEVCSFIQGIELCSEYVEVFKEQRIDGYCLSLLSENHLTTTLQMKLGPALKLRSILSTRAPKTSSNTQYLCSRCISKEQKLEKSAVRDGDRSAISSPINLQSYQEEAETERNAHRNSLTGHSS